MVQFENELPYVKDKRVVLLQSGGLDSCFLAGLLHHYGFKLYSVFVDYGQNSRHRELEAATRITEMYDGELSKVDISLPWLHDSTVLVGHEVGNPDVPTKLGCVEAMTYVPMRNHLLLSIAASYAESLGIPNIATAIDGAEDILCRPTTGCPDKHPMFAKRIEKSLSEGSVIKHKDNKKFNIIAPLMFRTKEQTIKRGLEIGCNFGISWTCYNSGETPCGECCACVDRKSHFDKLGVKDFFETP